MKLKKIVALILALAMCLTMAACSKDSEKTSGTTNDTETSATKDADTATEDAQQPAEDGEATADTGVQQEQAPISLENEDKNDKVGYVSGSTYRNPYFDLTFTAPENATYYDAQSLLSMGDVSNLPADTNAAFAAQMEQDGAYVMMVVDLNGEGANIVVKKTPDAYKGISEEEIYLLARADVEAQLQSNNLTGDIALGSTTFLGESRAVLEITVPNASMVQQQLILVQDDYTCTITAAAAEADTLAAIMELFTR